MQNPHEEVENLAAEIPVPAPVEAEAANLSPVNGVAATQPGLKFGRLFPKLERFRPPDDTLIKLGRALLNQPILAPNPGDPPPPLAGYTYLGQLITHDIAFDALREIPDNRIDDLSMLKQNRRRALSLETLYGIENDPATREENRDLYDARIPELTYLKLGLTDPLTEGLEGDPSRASRSYRNDLPRSAAPDQKIKAILGDARNDANLALAQITVAFLNFHNNVVESLRHIHPNDSTLFGKVREKVVRHYQWMVLHDFLPKIVEEEVLRSVLDPVLDDARHNRPRNLDGKWPFIPIEFSVAAFRLGHSMLRNSYEWNRFFQSPGLVPGGHAASLSDLFSFTHRSGRMGFDGKRLPSKWIVDWTRFFDFTGFNGIANNPKSNRSARIDTRLAVDLTAFPTTVLEVIRNPDHQSLPVLDLLRGSRLGLPSGQAVADELRVPRLTEDEIANDPHQQILTDGGFHKETPLWYYILKEAEVRHQGERLGPVGSHIVAETIIELMWVSQHSILQNPEDWKPDLGQKKAGEFGIADLLVFAKVVNPLGS